MNIGTALHVDRADCGGWRTLVAQYFPANEVDHACSTLMCESGGRASARNGRYVGLFEIANGPMEPEANIAAAARLFRSRGWRPWTCA